VDIVAAAHCSATSLRVSTDTPGKSGGYSKVMFIGTRGILYSNNNLNEGMDYYKYRPYIH
jgi:hypothetical protein